MLYQNVKKLLKRYFENFVFFYQRLGRRIIIRVLLSIAVSLFDGLGLSMFLPLLQMVEKSGSYHSENLGNLRFLVDGLAYLGIGINLLSVLIVLCSFFILKGLVQYASSTYEVKIRQYFVKTTRRRLTLLMGEMSYKNFVLSDVGKVQNTLSGEVSRLSMAFQQYFATVQQGVMVLVYIGFAFFVDVKFALIICLGGGLTNLLYKRIYAYTQAASRKLVFGTNYYQGLILQYVNSFKYLKATGLLKDYNGKLLGTIDHIEETNSKIGKYSAIVSGTREPLLIIVVSTVILIQVNVLGGSLGTILISLLFFYRALSSLMLMQSSYNGFLGVYGSIENMTEFEKELSNSREKQGTYELKEFKNQIVLEKAGLRYKDREILRNISLTIEKDRTIAFVGESGSGKTTLVNVLAGLIPLDEGKLLIDGIRSSELNMVSYQKNIGYITQDPVIFSDTIFNNVTFWADPTPENYSRFHLALKKASLEDFVGNLPEKELTELGNNGINLSGGQRQRISIARELFKDVDILILDEATSALDSETEKSIQENIESLHGKYTVLIVAHRLSTIKDADSIVVMSKGEIVESGSFDKLMKTSKKFGKMIELQEL
ncbi:ABC transporter ATP-binding protein [Paraflavisolibacter sp. H34]|uniref:ABC transporter ATP-binding protein n=1 Tax=Huijunlia imazamoxiresistens TaxID=3127457 RepID=UPI0030176815